MPGRCSGFYNLQNAGNPSAMESWRGFKLMLFRLLRATEGTTDKDY